MLRAAARRSMMAAMFVVVLTYVRPLEEVDKLMRSHVRFLNEQYRAGVFVASGRQRPRTGGVILARAPDRETITRVMEKDPFVVNGVARFELVEFRTSQYDPAFEPFADPDT